MSSGETTVSTLTTNPHIVTQIAQDSLPVIRAEAAKIAKSIDEACAALSTDPEVFVRSGKLVQVLHAKRATNLPDRQLLCALIEGTPIVRQMSVATLRDRLSRVADFEKSDAKGKWHPTHPHDHLVQGLRDRGEWGGIRELVGVIETPSMRPDGTIIDCPGWDAETGYLYHPSIAFPPVPKAPTQADAQNALTELMDVFQDFPFATEAAKYVPIAAIMAIIARPAIVGPVPAFVLDLSLIHI